ncbi:MAG: hypothetical protein EHM50_04270 [Lysobacterales bacterium]|nr:MAG: hypothetical protein EHM50_04270 [Xanthomonadales bacterium]
MSGLVYAVTLVLAGCGGSEPAAQASDPPPRRETVFDPMTSTIGRAQGVQQTVDEQAAEQRRRIEDAGR